MARKLKPVDDTPIGDPAYVRRIDPVWMPGPVPGRFWEDRKHRCDYLMWCCGRLRLRTMNDLYRLNLRTCFKRYCGYGLSQYWGERPLKAARDCFPEYDWKPWLFVVSAAGYWNSRVNRRKYMDWLGERLGYRSTDDWYKVSYRDFAQNSGSWISFHYESSPFRAVMDLIPAKNWCEWKFKHVPAHFWDEKENRHRYLRWLGKELGFRRPEDWYRIQCYQITRMHGNMLLRGRSLYDVMRGFLPQLDWERINRHQTIRVDEILSWADAYHAKFGKWPKTHSGAIPATPHSWLRIDDYLREGRRGLDGEVSLARLLEKHRDAPLGFQRSKLSETAVLDWAKEYFREKGRWPNHFSGPITGFSDVTWGAVDSALRKGYRGFPGGSSLPRLLRKHRLK